MLKYRCSCETAHRLRMGKIVRWVIIFIISIAKEEKEDLSMVMFGPRANLLYGTRARTRLRARNLLGVGSEQV